MAEPLTTRMAVGWPVISPWTPSSSNSNESVIGYPVVTGYPVTTSTAAVNNSNSFGFLITMMVFMMLTLLIVAVLQYLLPILPYFSVAFTSVTVHNDSDEHYNANLDVGFVVVNRETRFIFYDNIAGSAFHNKRHLFNFNLLPFEQRNNVETRVQVSSNHTAVKNVVNDWVKESICSAGSEGKSGASTTSSLKFELRGNASFRGWTWVRRRIFTQVVCENVKVEISSNSTRKLRFKPMPTCTVDGVWREYAFWSQCLFYALVVLYLCISLITLLVHQYT